MDTNPGQGSTFHVFLPVTDDERSITGTDQDNSESEASAGALILLIEDDQDILLITESTLTQSGYTVTGASTIEEACRAWNRTGGAFDLILTDMILPDGNGLALAEKLRPDKKTAFVIVSGYLEDNEYLKAIRDRGYRFVEKPYTPVTITKVLEEELRKLNAK